MATTVARLQAVLGLESKDFERGMDRSQSRMGKVQKAAGVAALAIGGGLVAGLTKSVGAAKESQLAQIQLEDALKSANISVAAHSKEIDNAIQKTSKLAALDDEDLSAAFAKLVRSTGNVKEATEGMNLAADIARTRNVSLEAATKSVEKAYIGSATGLRKFGVVVGAVTDEQDKLKIKIREVQDRMKDADGATKAALQQRIDELKATKDEAIALDHKATGLKAIAQAQDQFKGSAEAYGKSGAAASERISVSIENLEESIGKLLLPVVEQLSNKIATLADFMTEHEKITKVLIIAIGALAVVLGTVSVATKAYQAATVLATAAQWALNAAMTANPIGILVVALAALVAGVIVAYKESETFRKIVNETWTTIKQVVMGVVTWFTDTALPAITGFVDNVRNLFTGLRDWLRDHWKDALIIMFTGLPGALWVAFKSKWGEDLRDKFMDAFRAVRDWIKEHIVDAIVGFFEDLPNRVVDAVKGLGDKVTGAIGGIASHIPGIGDAADSTFSGGTAVNLMGANPIMAPFAEAARLFGLTVTSGLRPGAITAHGTLSDHAVGKALDVSGTAAGMAAFFRSLIGNPRVKQAFYDPLGSIFGGVLNAYREGGHSDHVHVATYDRGGWLKPGWTLAYNGLGRPEPVGGGMPSTIVLQTPDGQVLWRWMQQEGLRYQGRNGATGF